MDISKKQVTIKVVSSRGHDELTMFADLAVNHIKDQCDNRSKWAYLDGIQINPTDLNGEMLTEANDITLTNALIGG
jgi:hypothetical protein